MFSHVAVAPYWGKTLFWVDAASQRQQLHYLFFLYSPVGSPSCYLFLRYDIVAHPYSTAAVLHFNTVVAPYCEKALFWADAVSQGNNCITCSSHAVLLGRLHAVCFCTMTLLHTLTALRQCYIPTLQLPCTAEKRYFGRTLQARGTTALLVLSVLSCWVAFMLFIFAL